MIDFIPIFYLFLAARRSYFLPSFMKINAQCWVRQWCRNAILFLSSRFPCFSNVLNKFFGLCRIISVCCALVNDVSVNVLPNFVLLKICKFCTEGLSCRDCHVMILSFACFLTVYVHFSVASLPGFRLSYVTQEKRRMCQWYCSCKYWIYRDISH